jgi:hypothetical protein
MTTDSKWLALVSRSIAMKLASEAAALNLLLNQVYNLPISNIFLIRYITETHEQL